MSENEEEKNSEAIDPLGPTKLDPKRAFEMGAETPDAHAVPAYWSPPQPEVLDPLFPDYDISELIGRGGMGAVYRGVQRSLDRSVAIKVLPPEMAEVDPSFAARFENEAKSMARLDHPNIVHVYDFGRTEAGHWFIVMEFVDGMDFHQLIRSGELDQTGALNAVSQICDALQYAHEQGYVHRDIKPANIFINQKGILKVGDFGLAKMIEGDIPDAEHRDQPMLTQTGVSMGTPDYCAPEQLEGRPLDHRADIYSLGVMFYEMLTRELPRGNFPPPSKKVEVDVRIDDVVLRAMESEPEMRYSTAGEMRTEVEEVRTTGVAAEPSSVENEDNPKAAAANPTGGRAVVITLIVMAGLVGLLVLFSVLVGAGFLLLKPTSPKVEPLEKSPEVEVTKVTDLPQAASADRYGLPAFHGELRPIPGTAGWRTEEPGELVSVPIGPDAGESAYRTKVAFPADLTDLVSFYTTAAMYWFGIRADGSAVAWGADSKVIREMPSDLEDVVAISAGGEGYNGIALHRDGSVTVWATDEKLRQRIIFDQPKRIVSVTASGDGFLLVDAAGKLHVYLDHENAESMKNLKNVCAVSLHPAGFIVLHKDGTLTPVQLRDDVKDPMFEPPSDLPPVRTLGRSAVILDDGRAVEWLDGYLRVIASNAARLPLVPDGTTPTPCVYSVGGGWKFPDGRPAPPERRHEIESALAGLTLVYRSRGDLNWFHGIRPPSSQPDSASGETPTESAPSATKDAPFTNSLGMEFVPVPTPGGRHAKVLFSRWETRVADYRAFADETNREWPAPEFAQGEDHPAVNVSWEDAVAFCEWLTEREREAGSIGPGMRYRLPTDHEWSGAVEIGHLEDPAESPISKSPPKQDGVKDDKAPGFPMGDRVWLGFSNGASVETKEAGLSNAIVIGLKDGFAATAPVGSFKPNRLGLFDLSGNAWEWCKDTVDPESKYERVRRGTGWKTSSIPMKRSAMRNGATQDERSDVNGFRCVLSED